MKEANPSGRSSMRCLPDTELESRIAKPDEAWVFGCAKFEPSQVDPARPPNHRSRPPLQMCRRWCPVFLDYRRRVQSGVNDYLNGKYDLAWRTSAVCERLSRHVADANAYYWLGESYQQKDYVRAIQSFDTFRRNIGKREGAAALFKSGSRREKPEISPSRRSISSGSSKSSPRRTRRSWPRISWPKFDDRTSIETAHGDSLVPGIPWSLASCPPPVAPPRSMSSRPT